MTANNMLEYAEGISAEDAAVVENVLNYYMSCNNELKEILRANAGDHLQRMTGVGYITKKLLGPLTRAIITETPDGLFASDPEDYGVGWELRSKGTFGRDQLTSISEILLPTSNVLIVGAHIGTLAIPLSKKCAYVAAIEANPLTFQLLDMNVKLNSASNCEIFNVAANNKAELLCFLLSRANSGGSKRKPVNNHYIYHYDEPEEIFVQGVRLDDFFARRDFDIVLMDIEGSEYFALKGMQEILQRVKTLMFEFLPHHLRNVSNVTPSELVAQLQGFTTLTVPSLKKTVGAGEFISFLNYMSENGLEDDGIVFRR